MDDQHDSNRGPARRHRLRGLGVLPAMAVIIAVVAAACGGSSGPGVASLGSSSPSASSTSSGNGSGSPLAYAQCMRSHGIKDFPDPDANGGFDMGGNANSDLNPSSAQFQAADAACRSLRGPEHKPSAAQVAKMQANALKFSQCMRSHGVKDFPDPVFHSDGGGISISIKAGQGSDLNPNNPQFKAAQKACQGILGKAKGGGMFKSSGGGPSTSQSGSGSTTGGSGQ